MNTETVRVPLQKSVTSSVKDSSLQVAKIKRAAKMVCGTTHRTDAGSLTQVMKNRACYDDAVASAMAKAGLKTLGKS